MREQARGDRAPLHLLPDSVQRPPERGGGPSKRWILLGGAGVVLAIGAVIAFALGSGGGGGGSGDASKPPQNEEQAPVVAGPTQAPAATATPTVPVPTPTPRSAEDAVHEGAVDSPINPVTPSTEAPPFITPLKVKGRVIDGFGTARGKGFVHAGIDVSPGAGAFEVVAACDGTVVGADRSGTYGDYIVIDCGNGWKTVYANLSAIQVRGRQQVSAGQTVAVAQESFHFEIRWGDTPLDPSRWVSIESGPPLPTPTPTPTQTVGATPTPNSSPSQPPTPTQAPSGGSDPAPTATPIPPTATATNTPTPYPTATPTATPTPRPTKKAPTVPPPVG